MKITLAQFDVSADLKQNKKSILSALAKAQADEWVIFAEGALTGYFPEEASFLKDTSPQAVADAVEEITGAVRERKCYSLLGFARYAEGKWHNSVLMLDPKGMAQTYDKIELSEIDKNHFAVGTQLPVFTMGNVKFGVQVCRELLFPKAWAQLREQGAQIIFHVNNAIKPYDDVWEHVVIARAIENNCFVCSVNNSAAPQALASYLVAPSGKTLAKTALRTEQTISQGISLSDAESPY